MVRVGCGVVMVSVRSSGLVRSRSECGGGDEGGIEDSCLSASVVTVAVVVVVPVPPTVEGGDVLDLYTPCAALISCCSDACCVTRLISLTSVWGGGEGRSLGTKEVENVSRNLV